MVETTIDYELGFAQHMMKLLHLSRGTQMNIEGQYQGPRTYFNADTVLQHLNGKIYPLAFNVVTRAKASYLCIDLDKRFHTRLPIAIAELKRRKWHMAAFYTNGSSEGKGKVIVCLREPMAQARAVEMISDFYAACSSTIFWEYTTDNKDNKDLLPTMGEGGLLRIAGQHKFRNGPVESFYDLNGRLTDLSDIEPLIVAKLRTPIEARTRIDASFFKYKKTGFPAEMKFTQAQNILTRLASQIYTIYGNNLKSQGVFKQWLTDIADASPPIMCNVDSSKRALLTTEKVWKWMEWIQDKKTAEADWTPIKFIMEETKRSHFKKYGIYYPTTEFEKAMDYQTPQYHRLDKCSRGAGDLYKRLVEYVRVKQISRDNITLGYEIIADFLGIDKKDAWRKMQECLKIGIIVLVSEGQFVTNGIAPSKTVSNSYRLLTAEEFLKHTEVKLNMPIVITRPSINATD